MTYDGRFPVHRACGGAGCDECTHTGYERMGPQAIASLEARIAGQAAPAVPPCPPAARPTHPTYQLSFTFGD